MQGLIALLRIFKSISDALDFQPKFMDFLFIRRLKTNSEPLMKEKRQIFDMYKIALFLFPKFKSFKVLGPNKESNVQAVVRSL